jgi:hypothetical protein
MTENESTFPLVSARLQMATLRTTEPPGDLWSRIESAHARRTLRRRLRIRTSAGFLVAVLVCVAAMGARWHLSAGSSGAEIDWQARAQALELQLRALESPRGTSSAAIGQVEAELAQVDRSLQSAYDRKPYTNELIPLWKRRSELLDTLLVARKQGLALTSI